MQIASRSYADGWPKLGRDQAAGVVLAIRASAEGNRWLEQTCEQVVRAERVLLRFNAKNKFGHSAMLTTSPSSACTSTGTTRVIPSNLLFTGRSLHGVKSRTDSR
jgi:hypothetical protein